MRRLKHMRPIAVVPLMAIAVAIAYIGLGSRSAPTALPPAPTPPPAIEVAAGKLATEPKASAEALDEASTELSATLLDVYARAFLPPLPPPAASPSSDGTPPPATPIARRPAANYFLTPARAALANVFTVDPAVTVRSGTLKFSGIGTLRGKEPDAFLLEVTFSARGELAPPYGRPTPGPSPTPTPELRIVQEGLLYVVRTSSGWRVAGFDLELRERIEVGRRHIGSAEDVRAARWMP